MTPAAHWHENGEQSPFEQRYMCNREDLIGGDLTDYEVANEVYLDPTIMNLTIAKDRIRWLSQQLIIAEEQLRQLNEGERVVLPQNKRHAEAMHLVASNYFDEHCQKQTDPNYAYIYLIGPRKAWYLPNALDSWECVAYERFDYVECAIYRKKTVDQDGGEDVQLIEYHSKEPEGWIEPSPV